MAEVIRVLLVDETPERAAAVHAGWTESGAIASDSIHVTAVADALGTLRNAHFDVVAIDAGLARRRGPALLGAIEAASTADEPCAVVGLLDRRDEALTLQTLEAGIDECVDPGADPATLARHLQRALARRRARRTRPKFNDYPSARSFDAAPTPMWISTPGGRLIEVNEAMCEYLGRPRDEMIGHEFDSLLHPDDRAGNAHAFELLDEGERMSLTREQRFSHADGRALWAIVGLNLIGGTSGGSSHLIGYAQDITVRRRYEERLRHMADHDPLTGALNRRGFDRELARHVSRVSRYGPRGSLLMIDLDNFKQFNDSHGHTAGDDLIASIATGLQARLRVGDIVGRLGGDEFAVLLPEADREEAETVAAALVDHVRELGSARAPNADGRRPTASVGVYCFSGTGPFTKERALIAADLAMYDAKSSGRNGFRHHDPPSGSTDDDRPMTAAEPAGQGADRVSGPH